MSGRVLSGSVRPRLGRSLRSLRSWARDHQRLVVVVGTVAVLTLGLWTLFGERSPALLGVLALQGLVLGGLAVLTVRTRTVLRQVRAQQKVLAKIATKVNVVSRTRPAVAAPPSPPVDLTQIVHSLGAIRVDAAVRYDDLVEEVRRRAAAVEHATYSRLQTALNDELRAVEDRLTTLVTTKFDDAIAETDALLSLHRLVTVDPDKPTSGGFAASPQTLLELYTRALALPDDTTVVECGSGTSTVWLADACRRRGQGRVIALEHDETYAALTRDALDRQGLSDWADVRCAPLERVEIEATTYRWYARSTWDDLAGVGLLFVDGPPGNVGPRSRFPAFPVLAAALADGATVALDDVQRTAEQAIGQSWLSEPVVDGVTLTSHQKTGRTWFLRASRSAR